jgi:hypothetical protein
MAEGEAAIGLCFVLILVTFSNKHGTMRSQGQVADWRSSGDERTS